MFSVGSGADAGVLRDDSKRSPARGIGTVAGSATGAAKALSKGLDSVKGTTTALSTGIASSQFDSASCLLGSSTGLGAATVPFR